MDQLYIVYVDDQREILSTLEKDLKLFEAHVRLEACESASEAMQLIDELDRAGDHLAVLISDHIMPGQSGIDFLTAINNDGRFFTTKKVLLTGQATHKDTILAINNARIEKYIEKPWKSKEFTESIQQLLTQFIVANGIDYTAYQAIVHQPTLWAYLQKNT